MIAGVWEPGGPVGGSGHLASFAPGGQEATPPGRQLLPGILPGTLSFGIL